MYSMPRLDEQVLSGLQLRTGQRRESGGVLQDGDRRRPARRRPSWARRGQASTVDLRAVGGGVTASTTRACGAVDGDDDRRRSGRRGERAADPADADPQPLAAAGAVRPQPRRAPSRQRGPACGSVSSRSVPISRTRSKTSMCFLLSRSGPRCVRVPCGASFRRTRLRRERTVPTGNALRDGDLLVSQVSPGVQQQRLAIARRECGDARREGTHVRRGIRSRSDGIDRAVRRGCRRSASRQRRRAIAPPPCRGACG